MAPLLPPPQHPPPLPSPRVMFLGGVVAHPILRQQLLASPMLMISSAASEADVSDADAKVVGVEIVAAVARGDHLRPSY